MSVVELSPTGRGSIDIKSTDTQGRRNRRQWWVAYAIVMLGGLFVAAIAYQRSYQLYLGVSMGVLILLIVAWIKFPKASFGTTVFLALLGDGVTVAWWPFTKNLSSRESIFFLSDGVSLRPVEIVVLAALAATAYRNMARIGRPFVKAPLVWPFLAFLGLIAIGLYTGLSKGGDMRVAIFESRPLILLPLAYILAINTLETRTDYRRVYWVALTAIVIQSLLSLQYYSNLALAEREQLEALTEHGAAIGMNLLFVFLILAMATYGVAKRVRFTLLAASVPVIVAYLISQRRAAVVALAIALVMFAVTLFWRQRRTFWKVVPFAVIVTVGYLGAFWNSESSAGFPAQAVKTVVSPDQASEKDQSSNLYRDIENFNLSFTIRAEPVLGQGFGRPFLRPLPLPDISQFEFHEYLPHNSLLWLWIKMGYLGLGVMLYIIGRSIVQGVSRFRRVPAGIDSVVALSAVFFVVMFTVFLYVDIAWESRNVILMAVSMALCTGPLRKADDEPDPTIDDDARLRPVDPASLETPVEQLRLVPGGSRSASAVR